MSWAVLTPRPPTSVARYSSRLVIGAAGGRGGPRPSTGQGGPAVTRPCTAARGTVVVVVVGVEEPGPDPPPHAPTNATAAAPTSVVRSGAAIRSTACGGSRRAGRSSSG